MESRDTFSILFFVKRVKMKETGEVPIYARISVNKKRVEFSLKRWVQFEKWENSGKVKGRTKDIEALNKYLETIRHRLYECHRRLIDSDQNVTAESVTLSFKKQGKTSKSFIEVFEYHNKKMESLVNVEYSPSTIKRYKTTLKHLQEFMKYQYSVSDVLLSELKFSFINDLDFYLRTVRKCNNNSTVKYVRNVRKIINLAMKMEWIDKDPFHLYEGKVKTVEREYLTEEEILSIENKKISIERLDQVRDVFIFCCYTGLSFVDIANLSANDLIKGIDGEIWININRQKTDTKASIPLLPKAVEIMEKYKDNSNCRIKGKLLPVLSNQKYNSYLKELADQCGITKNLTSHTGRHSCATFWLTKGVSIESVSKMLGHKSIRTTQHYAKIVESKVSEEMKALKDKLNTPTEERKKGLF